MSVHENVLRVETIGQSVVYQPHCSCGWRSGMRFNGPGSAERAQAEFDQHVAVVPPE